MPSFDDLMADPVTRAAGIWYRAERAANPSLPDSPLEEVMAVALPRVRAVFAGEVRWSDASPGDKEVWIGRPRNYHLLNGHETYWVNVWDTVAFGPGDQSFEHRPDGPLCVRADQFVPSLAHSSGDYMMFGNAHIGNWFLSNMQVPHMLPTDTRFDIEQMYAVCSRVPSIDENVIATLNVGGRPMAQAHLRDLVLGHPVMWRVMPCQLFGVNVTWSGVNTPIKVVMHLEGVQVRVQG